jgi:5'-nucleotidase
MSDWTDYDISQDVLGAEADHGDVLVCKSGTDFRDLSEMSLEFESTPPGSVRKQVIKRITGMIPSSNTARQVRLHLSA